MGPNAEQLNFLYHHHHIKESFCISASGGTSEGCAPRSSICSIDKYSVSSGVLIPECSRANWRSPRLCLIPTFHSLISNTVGGLFFFFLLYFCGRSLVLCCGKNKLLKKIHHHLRNHHHQQGAGTVTLSIILLTLSLTLHWKISL